MVEKQVLLLANGDSRSGTLTVVEVVAMSLVFTWLTSMNCARIAVANQLGACLREFHEQETSVLNFLTFPAVGGLISLIMMWIFQRQDFLYPFVGMALGMAMAIFVYYLDRNNRLLIYEQGLVHCYQGEVQIARYDAIQYLWERVVVVPVRTGLETVGKPLFYYRIQTHSGSTMLLKADSAEIGNRLNHCLYRYEVPRLEAAYRAGETITFGDFYLNQHGVGCRETFFLWADLEKMEDISFRTSYFVKFSLRDRRSTWIPNITPASIPNQSVLLEFLERCLAGEGTI